MNKAVDHQNIASKIIGEACRTNSFDAENR